MSRKDNPRNLKLKTKTCGHCGKTFECLSLKARWCSNTCKNVQYKIKYPEKVAAQTLAWQRNNKQYIKEYKSEPSRHLAANLRSRLSKALSRKQKTVSMSEYLGCSLDELRTYIESKFEPGMTWSNYSVNGWHVDHIKPLNKFDLTDPDQLNEACCYTNLQPMWAGDNRSKGDSYEER
jgi:hypothetical protein